MWLSSHNGSWWYCDNEINFKLNTLSHRSLLPASHDCEQHPEIKAPDAAIGINRNLPQSISPD